MTTRPMSRRPSVASAPEDLPSRGRPRSESASRETFEALSRSDEGAERPTTVGKGWRAFSQRRTERSEFVKNFTLPTEPSLIKIMDEEPFTVFAEHWIDDIPGKKSYICIGDDCPLCVIGEKPRVYAMFNILDLSNPDDVQVRPWKVSQTVTGDLERYANDAKTSPLNREDLYWSIFKSGGGNKGPMRTVLNPVKARDVADDWDFAPYTAEELAEFNLLGEADVLVFSSRATLQSVADQLD